MEVLPGGKGSVCPCCEVAWVQISTWPSRCISGLEAHLHLLFAGWWNESRDLHTGGSVLGAGSLPPASSQEAAPPWLGTSRLLILFRDGCLGRPGQNTPAAGLGWEHRRAASLPEVSFAPSLPVIRRLAPRRFSATSCRCTWARACVAGLGHWVQGQGRGWGGLLAGGRPPAVAGAGGAPRPLLGGDLRRPALGVGGDPAAAGAERGGGTPGSRGEWSRPTQQAP